MRLLLLSPLWKPYYVYPIKLIHRSVPFTARDNNIQDRLLPQTLPQETLPQETLTQETFHL